MTNDMSMTFMATCVYGKYRPGKDNWHGYKTGETHIIRITNTKDHLFPYLLEVGNLQYVYPSINSIKYIWDF